MKSTSRTSVRLVAQMAVLGRDALRQRRDERGDVPGWVMITLMTAGVVAGLTAIAGPRMTAMLNQALSSVGG